MGCKDCGRKPERGRICYRCQKRRYRSRNPMKTSYQNLRSNARRRGKEFSLSFEEFEEFCISTDYLNGKGRSRDGYHIDRIDPLQGYHRGNIQILTNFENLQKWISWNGRDRDGKDLFITQIKIKRDEEEDCPF